jgi:type III secretion system low calcium response chaperone LcrH/SycD
MALTIEELKTQISQEKLSAIDMKQILQSFAEGKCFQDLLEISDEVMQEFYTISMNYYENGDYADAADCFLFLLALNPLESNLWIKSGNAEQALHHFEEALEAYSMATLCDADDPFPLLYTAQIYIFMKHKEQAKNALNICIQLIDENPIYEPIRDSVIKLQKELL